MRRLFFLLIWGKEIVEIVAKRRMEKRLNFRATHQEELMLGLVARRVNRSRSDTLRMLIRAAAVELDVSTSRREVRGDGGGNGQ